ncbi:hypothetical protein C8R43DRAFT_940894 [Mycena crocata]|nr:hypothetical protein C8R43DRAFT_940894 [Mycena crocata]
MSPQNPNLDLTKSRPVRPPGSAPITLLPPGSPPVTIENHMNETVEKQEARLLVLSCNLRNAKMDTQDPVARGIFEQKAITVDHQRRAIHKIPAVRAQAQQGEEKGVLRDAEDAVRDEVWDLKMQAVHALETVLYQDDKQVIPEARQLFAAPSPKRVRSPEDEA